MASLAEWACESTEWRPVPLMFNLEREERRDGGSVECAETPLFHIKGFGSSPFHLFTNNDKGDYRLEYSS